MSSALSGNLFLLKTPADLAVATGEGLPLLTTFETVGGFQTNSLTSSATQIDITNKSSSQNMKLLNKRGILNWSASGNGFLENTVIAKQLEQNQLSQSLRWFLLERSDGRSFYAQFKITEYSFEGSHDGAINFTITLNSSGTLRLTDKDGDTYSTGEDRITTFDSLLTSINLIKDKSIEYTALALPKTEALKKMAIITYLDAKNYVASDIENFQVSNDLVLSGSATASRFIIPIILLNKTEIGARTIQVLDVLDEDITDKLFFVKEKTILTNVYNAYYLNSPLGNAETLDIKLQIG